MFANCLASKLNPQLFKDFDIHIRQHDGGMCLAAVQLRELGESQPCIGIYCSAGRERDQYFICVETGILLFKYATFSFWMGSMDSGEII